MTCIPHQRPIVIVLGRPIPVPHVIDPPHELVDTYVQRFADEMEQLFERNKAACGCPGQRLRVL